MPERNVNPAVKPLILPGQGMIAKAVAGYQGPGAGECYVGMVALPEDEIRVAYPPRKGLSLDGVLPKESWRDSLECVGSHLPGTVPFSCCHSRESGNPTNRGGLSIANSRYHINMRFIWAILRHDPNLKHGLSSISNLRRPASVIPERGQRRLSSSSACAQLPSKSLPYSPRPSFSISSFGINLSAAELMQ